MNPITVSFQLDIDSMKSGQGLPVVVSVVADNFVESGTMGFAAFRDSMPNPIKQSIHRAVLRVSADMQNKKDAIDAATAVDIAEAARLAAVITELQNAAP